MKTTDQKETSEKPATLENFLLLWLCRSQQSKRAEVKASQPAEELQLSGALQKEMQQHVFCQSLKTKGEKKGFLLVKKISRRRRPH